MIKCLFLVMLMIPSYAISSTCNRSPSQLKSQLLSVVGNDNTKEEIKSLLKRNVDFEHISQTTLKEEWPKIQKQKKKEFTETLQSLIIETYASKLDEQEKKPEFEYNFFSPRRFSMSSEIQLQGTESDVIFQAHLNAENCWKISDIVIDEVSMSENYREQFVTVMKKHDFSTLLAKMKGKLKALRS